MPDPLASTSIVIELEDGSKHKITISTSPDRSRTSHIISVCRVQFGSGQLQAQDSKLKWLPDEPPRGEREHA